MHIQTAIDVQQNLIAACATQKPRMPTGGAQLGRSRLQNATKKHENDGLEDGLAAISWLMMAVFVVVDFVL